MSSRHTRRRSVLCAAFVVTALVAPAGPTHGAGARAESIHVPDHATLTVHGHGWGHGRGMSQFGAEGAARQGLSTAQILHFYYPHTQAGTFHGTVRVLISSDTDQVLTVVNRPGLHVRDLSADKTLAVPTTGRIGKATRWRMTSKPGKPAQVSYLTDSWHVWRTLTEDGEFRASKPIKLLLPGGTTAYRGSLRSLTSTRGGSSPHRITVNKVSIDDYVRGVVASEVYTSWHQAALRAQAIAARSYAAAKMRSPISSQYELCDTSTCQVYGGVDAEDPATDTATAKTAGQIRTHDGQPALTEFSSSNGGWTVKSHLPYQVAKRDPYDGWSGNLRHSWTTHVSAAAVEKAFGLGNLQRIVITQRDGNGQWNGRVLEMKLVGTKKTVTPSGDDFRSALGLFSTWFDISV